MNDDDKKTGLSTLTDVLESAVTGVPAPIRKNFFKAFGQLCTAAVDVPVAWLEGKAGEIRATTEARQDVIMKSGRGISERISIPQEYIDKASSKFASKIVKEQLNLDNVMLNATNEINSNKGIETSETPVRDISEDWLNEFENIARLKSSENMRFVFGKILAVEILNPGSLSIKTLKIISQLDNKAAELFQVLCGLTISLRLRNQIFDARVVSLEGNAGSNSLAKYGLPYDALIVLHEYGLVTSDFDCWQPYSSCIAKNQVVATSLQLDNKQYGLVPTDLEKYDKILKLCGVKLTTAGVELLDVVGKCSNESYNAEFVKFLKNKHLELVEIKIP